MPSRPDLYFSADVEADGPIPGPYSMLSFGLAVAGTFDGTTFRAADPTERTFYAELRPISDDFVPESLAVSGLDRDRLVREGRDPAQAMNAAARWIGEVTALAGDATPVLVAFPLSYDWMWMYWYFTSFAAEGSPFGHSWCIDLKTTYAIKAGVGVRMASKSRLPKALRSGRRHTHHALDDAVEQAELAAKLFTWDGTDGRVDQHADCGP
ncbi:exonuclease [Actinopolymorpha sp. B11F2]|uniref:exonuclease n=1 Tax=Actinopolymorpha sp. B11F2 TaxID=3160862 RepID=UPI0032E3AC0C